MEKVINIDINEESDMVEKYDNSKISQELLEYIIEKAKFTKKYDKIKIVINNNCQIKLNFPKMFYNAFEEEYKNNVQDHLRNNILQLVLLFLGIIFIFISFQIKNNEIWKEIFLIGGWVPIWEMVDLELFTDVRGKRRSKILLKLIDSEIVES